MDNFVAKWKRDTETFPGQFVINKVNKEKYKYDKGKEREYKRSLIELEYLKRFISVTVFKERRTANANREVQLNCKDCYKTHK